MERLTERKWETQTRPGAVPPLLDCPFCSGKAELIADGYNAVIRCTKCFIQTQRHTSITMAVGVWNKRV
jgi:transcription elongation factor Elf1